MVRLTVLARGRVQMVGYRMFVESVVGELGGVAGIVRNLPDGSSVEVIAEGQRAVLEALLGELKIGPAMAIVRETQVEWGVASGEFDGFTTVY